MLTGSGLPTGVELGAWSEVYLKLEEDLNYHFDYLVAPLMRTTLEAIGSHLSLLPTELEEVSKWAQKLRLFPEGTRRDQRFTTEIILPDISSFFIFEVMTASTSGSNRDKETDISSAFRNGILGKSGECPGINKRQVWGRMVTQLFSKTALAEEWGGTTIWVIQDELMANIEMTTRLNSDRVSPTPQGNINIAIMHYEIAENGERSGRVAFKEMKRGTAGINFEGSNTYADILLPSRTPPKSELFKALMRRPLAARYIL